MPLIVRKDNKVTSITAQGLPIVERLAANGCSDASIASTLGTTSGVLRRLLREDERVALAYEKGKGKLADELTAILLTHAREGNVTAAIFLSKARLGWRDVGPSTTPSSATQVNIHIPAPMSPEDFKKLITSKVITVEAKEVKSDAEH